MRLAKPFAGDPFDSGSSSCLSSFFVVSGLNPVSPGESTLDSVIVDNRGQSFLYDATYGDCEMAVKLDGAGTGAVFVRGVPRKLVSVFQKKKFFGSVGPPSQMAALRTLTWHVCNHGMVAARLPRTNHMEASHTDGQLSTEGRVSMEGRVFTEENGANGPSCFCSSLEGQNAGGKKTVEKELANKFLAGGLLVLGNVNTLTCPRSCSLGFWGKELHLFCLAKKAIQINPRRFSRALLRAYSSNQHWKEISDSIIRDLPLCIQPTVRNRASPWFLALAGEEPDPRSNGGQQNSNAPLPYGSVGNLSVSPANSCSSRNKFRFGGRRRALEKTAPAPQPAAVEDARGLGSVFASSHDIPAAAGASLQFLRERLVAISHENRPKSLKLDPNYVQVGLECQSCGTPRFKTLEDQLINSVALPGHTREAVDEAAQRERVQAQPLEPHNKLGAWLRRKPLGPSPRTQRLSWGGFNSTLKESLV